MVPAPAPAQTAAAYRPPTPPPVARPKHPHPALYRGLRTSLRGLGHLTLKETLAGEGATTVLASRVQLSNSLVAPASLQGASFEAPRGNSSGSITFPSDLGLGAAASIEVSFTTLQVNTHGQASIALDSPTSSLCTEYLDVSLSDHSSHSPLTVHDTAEPLVLFIPIDAASLANPEPQPCTASEAAIGLCAVCDAADARLGRHNCSGHGACTTYPPHPTHPTPTPPLIIIPPLSITTNLTLFLTRCVRARSLLVRWWPHH